MHTSVARTVEGATQSTEALEVVLQRGADRSAMFIETEVVEDADGANPANSRGHQPQYNARPLATARAPPTRRARLRLLAPWQATCG